MHYQPQAQTALELFIHALATKGKSKEWEKTITRPDDWYMKSPFDYK